MTLGLSVDQVLAIHSALRSEFGGRAGLRDRGALEAAVARPFATFDGEDLYPDVASKAALSSAKNELWLSPVSIWEFLVLAEKGSLKLDRPRRPGSRRPSRPPVRSGTRP